MIRVRELESYLCPHTLAAREALQRLNQSEHLFQLVVAEDGRLMGTLTDGDIRRALLGGASLETPVEDHMHLDFIAGRAGDASANEAQLARSSRLVTFLPVLNENNRVIEVLVETPPKSKIQHALVMAGGYGRRLGDRTRDTPKPLLKIGGKPILDRVLDSLEVAGVQRIFVSVHYLSDQIETYVAKRQNVANIETVHESAPLGTAGAIGQVAVSLGSAPFLVVNGDVITDADILALHEFHMRHGLDATIGVTRHDVDVPFGVVRYGDDGLFDCIDEKPRISNFIAAGIYYLGSEFAALAPKGKPIDMPELLGLGKSIGLKIGLFPIHEFWTDVGHPKDLEAVDIRARLDVEGT